MREQLEQGVPLSYLALCRWSWLHRLEREDEWPTPVDLAAMARTLRRQLDAANEADRLPPARRSTSPAVGLALRSYQKQSADHRAVYGEASRSPEAWESAARLLDLRLNLERAIAKASGSTRDFSGIEHNAARHRAEAERLRKMSR